MARLAATEILNNRRQAGAIGRAGALPSLDETPRLRARCTHAHSVLRELTDCVFFMQDMLVPGISSVHLGQPAGGIDIGMEAATTSRCATPGRSPARSQPGRVAEQPGLRPILVSGYFCGSRSRIQVQSSSVITVCSSLAEEHRNSSSSLARGGRVLMSV